jgi:hypothetical protein
MLAWAWFVRGVRAVPERVLSSTISCNTDGAATGVMMKTLKVENPTKPSEVSGDWRDLSGEKWGGNVSGYVFQKLSLIC